MNPTNDDWIKSWLAFKEENRDSDNWIIYRAIKNDDMYQLAPTGVKIQELQVPNDDSGDEEQEEDLLGFVSGDEDLIGEDEADKDPGKELLDKHTAKEREDSQ